VIVAPAFIQDIGARAYVIDNAVAKDGSHKARFNSILWTDPATIVPRMMTAGSGAAYVLAHKDEWQRDLLNLVNKHDEGRLSDDLVIADRLASLAYEVHQHVETVGPSSVVMWRRRKGLDREISGGAHQFYVDGERDASSSPIPSIMNGVDMGSIFEAMMRDFKKRSALHPDAGSNFEEWHLLMPDLTTILPTLPSEPDEELR
jgi:hypothetical protein